MSSIVRLPRLLNADLSEKARPVPSKLPMTIETYGVSTAQMTLGEDQPDIKLHDIFELYTIDGSVGLFRATNTAWTVRNSRVITLRHCRDTFADSVWKRPDGTSLDYSGTVPAFLAEIISRQVVAHWQLGTCEDTSAWKKSGIYYTRLSDLLDELEKKRKDYIFTYDFSTTPWTLNYVHVPSDIAEFRLSRNVTGCKISYDDESLCNKLYMTWSVNTEDGRVQTILTYENSASQAVYGVIEKTVDVKESDEPSADAWAADFLATHGDPSVQISIDGANFYALTGVALDNASRGKMARVALPDYGVTVNERVISIKYADAINEPNTITADLSNNNDNLASTLAQIQRTADSGASAASEANEAAAAEGRRARYSEGGLSAEISETASEIRSELYSADSNMRSVISQTASEIRTELWAADSKLFSTISQTATEIRSEVANTESGFYSLVTQTATSIRSELWAADSKLSSSITQTASSIRSEVANAESGIYSAITQTASSIRSELWAADSKLSSSITQTASSIRSEISNTESGLYSAITQTASSIRSELWAADSSLWTSITANASSITTKVGKGEVISMINQTSEAVTISANKIDLSGYVTASQLGVTNATISNLTSGTTVATALKATLLQADSTFNFAGSNMHLISLSCGGTTLSVMSSANANVSFTHYHAFSVSESNGVISLTLGTDQYTSPGTQTFNMADTEYFQQQMSAERTAGYNTSESEISVNGYYTNSGWSSNQITYYCYARAKESGTYTKVYEITANASSIYTAGYNASEGEISVNGYYTSSAWSNNEKTYYCYARAKNSGNYTNVYDITVNAQSVYNSGYSAGQSNADLSSYSLHVSKSQGNVYLYLNNGSGTTVKSRTASIAITSLVKSTNSNAWNITVRIDGDTDFYFTKLPTG